MSGQPFSVTVRRSGGELFIKVPLRGESPLGVAEDGSFLARNGSEEIGVSFREGEEGVEALLIHWGGSKIAFDRKL